MANKTIAEVEAVLTLSDAYKVPISTGNGQAQTATLSSIKNYCRKNSVEWDEITNKPKVGSGTISIYQGGTEKGSFVLNDVTDTRIELDAGGGGASVQVVETVSSATPSLAVASNTFYRCTSNITSLTITSIPSDTTESDIQFTAGGDFTVSFTPARTMTFGSPDIVSGSQYLITIKNQIVTIATPNYT